MSYANPFFLSLFSLTVTNNPSLAFTLPLYIQMYCPCDKPPLLATSCICSRWSRVQLLRS